jgi:hypothetical protein
VLSRVLALVVAVGLVVGALAIRARLDGGEGVPVTLGRDASGAVICATEVEQACRDLVERSDGDLTVRVEEAGVTLDALGSADPPTADAWVTLQPWPEMARERRARASLEALIGDSSDVLGRSPVVLAAREERARPLGEHCGGLNWDCIGSAAANQWANVGGRPEWGPVKPSLPDPDRTATGLLVLSQAIASRVGTPDFTTTDLRDPGHSAWLTGFARALTAGSARSPLETMILTGSSQVEFTGVIEAVGRRLLDRATVRAEGINLLDGDPPMAAEVVVVPLGGAEGVAGRVADEMPAALEAAGWSRPGEDGQLAQDAGLPRPGAMEALRSEWSEVK